MIMVICIGHIILNVICLRIGFVTISFLCGEFRPGLLVRVRGLEVCSNKFKLILSLSPIWFIVIIKNSIYMGNFSLVARGRLQPHLLKVMFIHFIHAALCIGPFR